MRTDTVPGLYDLGGENLDDFTQFTLEAGVFGHHNRDGALASPRGLDPPLCNNPGRYCTAPGNRPAIITADTKEVDRLKN